MRFRFPLPGFFLLLGSIGTGVLLAQSEPAPVDRAILNEAFALEIWADANLWDDSDAQTAQRLGWPEESRSPEDASFRLYPRDGARILGCQPHSLVLYSRADAPEQISIVFANQGDFQGTYLTENRIAMALEIGDKKTAKQLEKALEKTLESFPTALETDAKILEGKLTALLGPGQPAKMGEGKSLREKVLRWDWGGHAILLSVQENSYVGLRILPTTMADNRGLFAKTGDGDLKSKLAKRVVKRENGDVIIAGIPMVNQGPKGYCVPATWERYLRYMGMPADMYILARAGGTNFGGGTSTARMAEGAKDLLQAYGRKLDVLNGKIETKTISKAIDEGLPIMWGMFVDRNLDRDNSTITEVRKKQQDWSAWKKDVLKKRREAAKDVLPNPDSGHVRLITGYNPETEELACSDSWGPEFEERWMTYEEANAVSMGDLQIIRW
jgi:hypothetical protein